MGLYNVVTTETAKQHIGFVPTKGPNPPQGFLY